ncbi:hypothetical protein KY5_2516 [Streptomyces formicae]|uniref:Uncharacterized protein n=1 Tax=Streptomyces formicae TaxID=1616117 RepID=A0A291Q7Y0_9ACTN|nr:hypothetical protein KY5_2516 [Streptomyces formicae]
MLVDDGIRGEPGGPGAGTDPAHPAGTAPAHVHRAPARTGSPTPENPDTTGGTPLP